MYVLNVFDRLQLERFWEIIIGIVIVTVIFEMNDLRIEIEIEIKAKEDFSLFNVLF